MGSIERQGQRSGERPIHTHKWGKDAETEGGGRQTDRQLVQRQRDRQTDRQKQRETKIQTHKKFKGTLFIRTKHNKRIFGVIPFIKLQNDA